MTRLQQISENLFHAQQALELELRKVLDTVVPPHLRPFQRINSLRQAIAQVKAAQTWIKKTEEAGGP